MIKLKLPFEIDILSYVASLIATVLGLIEPFGKKMKTILTFNFL